MRKISTLTIFSFLPTFCFAQYWGGNATEENFEQSSLLFKSHYLNTFGVYNFKDVAVGFVDEPFLNLYLNPANLPSFQDKKTYFYLDFRGDRTEPKVVSSYNYYAYDSFAPVYDPRWYTETRTEPEPIFSLGVLTYPFSEKLLLGGTYQIVHKNESFYQVPNWIYRYQYGYDNFGSEIKGNDAVPIIDRSYGEDELTTKAHLFSFFTGYKLTDKINLGISLNRTVHSREGGYVSSQRNEYSSNPQDTWIYYSNQEKNQDYDHYDFNGGFEYFFSESSKAGLKLGYLKGKAEQTYTSLDSSFYKQNEPNVSDEWNYSLGNSSTKQTWNHDGKTYYGSIDFRKQLDEKKNFSGYYRFTNQKVDLQNSTAINDTSYYSNRYYSSYDSTYYNYLSYNSTLDNRNGNGTRKDKVHELAANLQFAVTEKVSVTAGIYVKKNVSEIVSSEPVFAKRSSYNNYWYNGNNPYFYSTLEDKTLEWSYKIDELSLQVPVFLNYKVNDYFSATLGVNRVLTSSEVKNETIAYFKTRKTNENGVEKTETNFGERYKEPTRNLTNNHTNFITNFEASVTPDFKISLLLEPEFENEFRVAQWWLSFKTKF
ncbi:hypothetical protein IT568_09350 [bacterium]|nr:hypothetical protein [bacterium]